MAAATSGFVIEEKSTGADGGVVGGACATARLEVMQNNNAKTIVEAMMWLGFERYVGKLLGGLTPCRSPGRMAFCDVDGAGRVVIGSTQRGGRNPAGN